MSKYCRELCIKRKGIWTLALTGVIAYTGDEIKRRQKEIGIRKINGATVLEIIRLFLKENTYLLLPAAAVGTTGGYFWGEYWLRNFSNKIAPDIWIFFAIPAGIIAIIYLIQICKLRKTAYSNPIRLIQK